MARQFAQKFYKSRAWKQTREYCLKRDNYLCQHCGRPAEEVHHIVHLTPENIRDESIALNPDNLACLCRDCHFAEHKVDRGEGQDVREDLVFDENGFAVRA